VVTARAFLSLLAGFAAMAVIVTVATVLLRLVAPEWVEIGRHPRPAYVFVNLGYSFVAAAAGGYVTAWATGMRPLPSVVALAVVVLALGAISALQARGRQPAWYQLVLLILAPLGVVAGGLVRLRVMGMV
jgi:hypothetical protein